MADYDDLISAQLVTVAEHINKWQKTQRNTIGGTLIANIDDGDELTFETGFYNGNAAATQAITGLSFQPRLVMIWTTQVAAPSVMLAQKSDQDGLFAMVQGRNGGGSVEQYTTDDIISLNSGGFTVGDGSTAAYNIMNASGRTYQWVAYR